MITNQEKRDAIMANGYTICNGSPTCWYALLPGETQFFDNIEEVEKNPEVAHEQNYLGIFSSEQDLLDEVFDEVCQ